MSLTIADDCRCQNYRPSERVVRISSRELHSDTLSRFTRMMELYMLLVDVAKLSATGSATLSINAPL